MNLEENIMDILSLITGKKHRRNPIKRDREGKSLRRRCFDLFDLGHRPAEVARELKMKKNTTYRYYRDWKNTGMNYATNYRLVPALTFLDVIKGSQGKFKEIFRKVCTLSFFEYR